MSFVMIVGFGAGYLVLLGFLLFAVRPKAESRRLQLLADAAGLPLTAEIEPVVRVSQRREVRAGFIGIVAGIIVASIGMIVAHVSSPGPILLVDFTAVFVATGISIAISTVAGEDRRQKSEVRLARLSAITIADYRSPLEQWMPRIVIALALAAFALRVILTPGGAGPAAVFIYLYAALMVLSLAISEIASRALVKRGQPAGSELELAWDDALRSRALAAVAVAPFYLGAYFGIAAVTLYPSSGSRASALGVQAEAVVVILAALLILVSAIVSSSGRPRQRYLRRLWPNLAIPAAAGEPSVPAAPAPTSARLP